MQNIQVYKLSSREHGDFGDRGGLHTSISREFKKQRNNEQQTTCPSLPQGTVATTDSVRT